MTCVTLAANITSASMGPLSMSVGVVTLQSNDMAAVGANDFIDGVLLAFDGVMITLAGSRLRIKNLGHDFGYTAKNDQVVAILM